jgi:hypothetical protein
MSKDMVGKYDIFDPDPRSHIQLFGVECGRGWLPLIEKMCFDLAAICKKESALVSIGAIWQEMGRLEVKASGLTTAMKRRIMKTELMASRTCEVCGRPGTRKEINAKIVGYEYIARIGVFCSKHGKDPAGFQI